MNSPSNLLKRLIKLYPVKLLKEEFSTTNVSDELYEEIIGNVNPGSITDFAYSNIDSTKQHVYIFYLNSVYNNRHFDATSFPFTLIHQDAQANKLSLIISPLVDFRVVLNNPYDELVIKFHQPCVIILSGRHLIIRTTILEKNIGSYFPGNRKVLDVQKEHDEQDTISKTLDYFKNYDPRICDLNRGIKYLWGIDSIDSKFAKWKKNRSTTTEAMDENYTLKSQYPSVYNDIITSPIGKTIFKYLISDERLPDHFTCDPTNGEISVALYPKNLNQIQNVIDEILSNN
jgi:hypothetical protein